MTRVKGADYTACMPEPHARLPFALRVLRRLDFPHKLGICDRLFGKSLAAQGIAWTQTAEGPLWKLDLRSASHRWIVYGNYGAVGFIEWARAWLSDGGVVVDSGANIGQTLLYFANASPKVRVLAFEPNPAAAAWIRECIERQRDWAVEVVQAGLSHSAGTVELRIPAFEGEQGAQGTMSAWYGAIDKQVEQVRVGRLDDYARERDISRIRLWKLDVEGWELHALQGADQLLRRRAIDAVYIEVHASNASLVQEFLSQRGYALFRMAGNKLAPHFGPLERTSDLLALPSP